MSAYTRNEKALAMMVADLLEATVEVTSEMRRRDWAITADQNQRIIYQRAERARAELDAARHYIARMQIGPTLSVRPTRPVEPDFLPDLNTSERNKDAE